MPVSRDEIRIIVLAFPGASEHRSYGGEPGYRIGRTFFTWVRPEVDLLVLRVELLDERDSLIESDPRIFHITDHYRDYPAVLVRLGAATPKLVRGLLERRFRAIATRKLIAEWEARR